MRRLMWFALGMAAAFITGITFLWNSGMPVCLAASLVLVLLLVLPARYFHNMERIQILFIGCAAGFAWLLLYQWQYVSPIMQYDGQTVPLAVTASTFSEQSRYSMMVDGIAELDGKKYKVRVYLDEDRDVTPGDQMISSFRLRLTTPDGQKESAYYQGKGFFLIASQKGDMEVIPADRLTLRTMPVYFVRAIEDKIDVLFADDVSPFAKALLLGDTDELSYETDTALKVSGIRHIAAVSGLHVAILYGAVVLLLGRRGILSTLLSWIVLLVFAAAAGFTPSVTRACIMTGVLGLSYTLEREYDPPTALSFACICMLMVNPFAASSASLQLSVSSVAGILMFAQPLNIWLRSRIPVQPRNLAASRIIGWFTGTVAVTLSAMVFTTPFTVYYFGMISLIGVLTNLLTLWIISTIFIGIIASCILGAMSEGVGSAAAWVIGWLIRYVQFVAGTLARFSFAAVYTESKWIAGWVVLCYILLILFFLRGRKRGKWYFLVGALSLVLAISVSCLLHKQDDFRVTVVSVGEGQCILLQSRGEAFLIDCGGDLDAKAADAAASALMSQGVFHLDGLALTHYDRDHAGAVTNLMSRVKVKEFFLPVMEDKGFLESIEDRNIPKNMISETTVIPFGTGYITFYQPDSLKSSNENCMCVLFATENCAILITGDRSRSGEKKLMKQETLPDVDILIAGHHGSKTSASEELLEAVKPEIVIISCGAGNSYGHPAKDLLERLDAFGCRVLRTDTMGTITIRR